MPGPDALEQPAAASVARRRSNRERGRIAALWTALWSAALQSGTPGPTWQPLQPAGQEPGTPSALALGELLLQLPQPLFGLLEPTREILEVHPPHPFAGALHRLADHPLDLFAVHHVG